MENLVKIGYVVIALLIASALIGTANGIKKGSIKPVIIGVLPFFALVIIGNLLSASKEKGEPVQAP